MDVEGMPDRDFYYLISLRHEAQGGYVEQFFWADGPEGECDIWQKCLSSLREIENPQIVHYGAYESWFLKHMRERGANRRPKTLLVQRRRDTRAALRLMRKLLK
jgi:hypothetical protein